MTKLESKKNNTILEEKKMIKSMNKDIDNIITIKQIASGAGRIKKQIATLKGLGLGKINKSSKLENTPAIRGMIEKVKHLVVVI